MRHHAFVIEAPAQTGVETALAWAARELSMEVHGNPDIVILHHGLFSVADARRVVEIAAGAPFSGAHKVLIVVASRLYHEAQNALLKLFEEPPQETYLFLVLPTFGSLLPTLRSRVQILKGSIPQLRSGRQEIANATEQFLAASKEKRSAIIKNLTSGSDEGERRKLRDEAVAIVNGVEVAAYAALKDGGLTKPSLKELLLDIAVLRGYLHDRSAPVKMILEHLSLVTPRNLL